MLQLAVKDQEREAPLPGDVVMLPDGLLVSVERVVGDDAHVVELHRPNQRSPWIFQSPSWCSCE